MGANGTSSASCLERMGAISKSELTESRCGWICPAAWPFRTAIGPIHRSSALRLRGYAQIGILKGLGLELASASIRIDLVVGASVRAVVSSHTRIVATAARSSSVPLSARSRSRCISV